MALRWETDKLRTSNEILSLFCRLLTVVVESSRPYFDFSLNTIQWSITWYVAFFLRNFSLWSLLGLKIDRYTANRSEGRTTWMYNRKQTLKGSVATFDFQTYFSLFASSSSSSGLQMAWAFHSFTQLSTPPENKWMDEWIKNKEFATLETKRVPGAEMRLAIERFHMTSRRLHCYSKTMKRRPCWFPKPTLWQLKSFLMETLSFVPINVHRCSLLGTCRSAIGQFFVLIFNFITL